MANGKKRGLRIAGKILWFLLSLVLLTVLGLVLIIGQPQKKEDPEALPQPLLTASPAVTIQREIEFRTLLDSFPAPVMSFMSGSGMVFVSGSSTDTAYNGGFGRVATLYWQTADGQPLILQSIYPARALSLIGKGDYSFSSSAGPTLFSQSTVLMENADTLRVHTSTDAGLYVLTVPRSLASSLSDLCRSIQLFRIDPEDMEP